MDRSLLLGVGLALVTMLTTGIAIAYARLHLRHVGALERNETYSRELNKRLADVDGLEADLRSARDRVHDLQHALGRFVDGCTADEPCTWRRSARLALEAVQSMQTQGLVLLDPLELEQLRDEYNAAGVLSGPRVLQLLKRAGVRADSLAFLGQRSEHELELLTRPAVAAPAAPASSPPPA